MGLASLGQSIIKQVAIKKFKIIANVDSITDKFKVSCPTPKEIQEIINKKNKLLNILNQLKRKTKLIDKSTKTLTALVKALDISLKVLKAAQVPAAPLKVGEIMIISDGLILMKTQKTEFSSNVKSFGQINNYVIKTINELLSKIKHLEVLIERCVQNPNQNPNIPIPTQNDTNLNNIINNQSTESNQILDINNQLNSEENDLINDLQNSESNDKNTYNGFKFEILLDDKNVTRFPKRYAIARNASGIIVLKGEPSFSSSIEILIDELKFIIDRDNLKAN